MFSFFPEKGSVVKRKVGDSIKITSVLDDVDDPKDIIMEVWTNIKDGSPTPKRFFGYKMRFDRKEGNSLFYSADLALRHSGFFDLTVRYRKKDDNYWIWPDEPDKMNLTLMVDPSWTREAVVYNAFIRFFGAEDKDGDGIIGPGEGGSFDDLKKELKNLKRMGINVLYLNPIHPIGDLYRNYNPHDILPAYLQPGCPYSIRDYKQIDPELGIDKDDEDGDPSFTDAMNEFRELVSAAHKLGIRVFMDLVFNHSSHDCVFQRLHPEWYLYKENIKDLNGRFIYHEDLKKGKPWGDPKHTFCPFDHGYWWEDVAQLNWEYRIPEGDNKPPKNPTLKEMYEYFKSIPKYWVRNFGIDGFRCDVAYRIPPDFWKECIAETRRMAKNSFPDNGSVDGDVVFIAESYVDDLDLLLKAGFTACYGDFHNKLYSPLTLKGYLDYIYNIDGQYFPDGSDWFHFPECHDWLRTPAKITGRHDFDSHNTDSDEDVLVNKSRWVLTATLPGIPMIFNGFEKMEWKAVNLFGYSSIDWDNPKDIRKFIRKVLRIRSAHPALFDGHYSYIETEFGVNEHTQLMSYLRYDQKENILVVVNMDINDSCDGTKIILEGLEGIDTDKPFVLKDLLTNRKFDAVGKEVPIFLGPGESHIFQVLQRD